MSGVPYGSEPDKELWYNDEVRVLEDAPAEFRPGALALVVGNDRTRGELRYIIEFFDGSSVELPARLVRPTAPKISR